MSILRAIYRFVRELAGETDYSRYCEHLRTHHPNAKIPTEHEFYVARLEAKYSRPSRCC